MKKCKYKWLITYDDSPEIRDLFDFANIKEYSLQYGMNNYKQKKQKKEKNYLYIIMILNNLKVLYYVYVNNRC